MISKRELKQRLLNLLDVEKLSVEQAQNKIYDYVLISFKVEYRKRSKPESKQACVRQYSQLLEAFVSDWNKNDTRHISYMNLSEALSL